MNYDEQIAVIEAAKEGKALECRRPLDLVWEDCFHKQFDFQLWEYRIKVEPPKPREFWVELGGSYYSSDDGLPSSRGATVHFRQKCYHNGELIHVREVIE